MQNVRRQHLIIVRRAYETTGGVGYEFYGSPMAAQKAAAQYRRTYSPERGYVVFVADGLAAKYQAVAIA